MQRCGARGEWPGPAGAAACDTRAPPHAGPGAMPPPSQAPPPFPLPRDPRPAPQVADWDPKISRIVDWFGQLQAVDVEGVAPAVHAHDARGALRPDEPVTYGAR